jgi:hypothetical protein
MMELHGVLSQEVRFMRSLAVFVWLSFFVLPAHATELFGVPFDLNVGEFLQLGDNELIVGFEGILSDSRCPEGVWCFWEGDAAADLWIQIPGQEKQDFVLHTYSVFATCIELGPFTVNLQQVAPYPNISEPIDPDAYVVTLVVSRGIVSVDERSWGAVKSLYR